jgi:hypothetical protein
MAQVDFKPAPEVKEIAEELIDKYHPHLRDAKHVIGYYFRDGASDWAGRAKKCTAFERHVTGFMLFMFINEQAWYMLTEEQQRALVDHELCHYSRKQGEVIDPKTKQVKIDWLNPADPDSWSIRDHDVEEFSDVIRRHGLWETGIESFAAAVRYADHQMTFEDVERENFLKVVK